MAESVVLVSQGSLERQAAQLDLEWHFPSLRDSADRDRVDGGAHPGDQSSAHRFLHERADPCLFGGSQLLQREGDRPQGSVVEVRRVAEAERRVPRFELLRGLEVADDLAVLGVRGHAVPGSRREDWRAGFDDRMEPLGHGAIRFPQLGDLREDFAFPIRLVRAWAAARGRLQLLDAVLHRGSLLVRESLELLVDRGGTLGGPLRVLFWAHGNLLRWCLIVVEASFQPPKMVVAIFQNTCSRQSRRKLSELAFVCLLQIGDDDLLHLEHGVCHSFGFEGCVFHADAEPYARKSEMSRRPEPASTIAAAPNPIEFLYASDGASPFSDAVTSENSVPWPATATVRPSLDLAMLSRQ